MNINNNFSQVQQMTHNAIKFGQAQKASKQQNLRHIEAATAKQNNVAHKVVSQAVETSYQSADIKGKLIDAMV